MLNAVVVVLLVVVLVQLLQNQVESSCRGNLRCKCRVFVNGPTAAISVSCCPVDEKNEEYKSLDYKFTYEHWPTGQSSWFTDAASCHMPHASAAAFGLFPFSFFFLLFLLLSRGKPGACFVVTLCAAIGAVSQLVLLLLLLLLLLLCCCTFCQCQSCVPRAMLWCGAFSVASCALPK